MSTVSSPTSRPDPDVPGKPRRSFWHTLSRVMRGTGVVVICLVAALAHLEGSLLPAVILLPFIAVPLALAARAWFGMRKQLELAVRRRPLAPRSRRYILQFLNRGTFWVLFGTVYALALPASVFSPGEYRETLILAWSAVALLAVLEAFPPRRVYLAANLLFLAGNLFLGFQVAQIHLGPSFARDAVLLDPPFRGEWYVGQGGRSSLLSHHWPIEAQQHALDLDRSASVISGDPKRLESYPAFGQPLLAPADGTVVVAVGDQPEQAIGASDEKLLVGNHVVIRIAPERFVLFAHMKHGSLRVRKGDLVKSGHEIGLCGNSGNTTEPHLHLQVQSKAEWDAAGLRTFPMRFRNATLIRGGRRYTGETFELRRNDGIARLN